jgi:hypothetical protein
MKQYTVYMQWDSYEGSLFVETSTAWYFASSQDDANNQARNQYGYHKGFKVMF